MPELTLYQSIYCPFCVKVTNFLNNNNIEVNSKDTMEDPSARQELIGISGRAQVPCLVIDGAPLLESNDIIQWFKDNWK
ncbi:MAG: glutaredoxin [Lentisphaeraceae bacterium]|nr:glutaredoxin [Lentisphaeraceae bacterium]